MTTIEISGHPLPEPLTFEAEFDEYALGEGWIISLKDARTLLDAWESAPKEDDIVRAYDYDYKDSGTFVTALCMEGTINISFWECLWTSYNAQFNTSQAPFDFEIKEIS